MTLRPPQPLPQHDPASQRRKLRRTGTPLNSAISRQQPMTAEQPVLQGRTLVLHAAAQ
ncbi:MAG: hypothetical protein M0Q42_07895 [Xanthomonadales bacterium]|nr:hypothetical protein [Xanthomonadales bacterium]